ncbi:DUF4272 domain-containing protein [Fulvivirga ligni]|uniref:DUF4272 domain-containing protein n=1 Tax=Fulvivirga ligni TaxID=2904246 RepID=UPI001F38BB58|nr:DUF4272 domain-containing protein [Fulvivirga ligni]UII19615.1 DUF4272 domain-containing protein [Fulvivirga ligni]
MFGLFKSKKELTRKEKTEKFLEKKKVKINYNLPPIESEEETILRSPKEVAQRVTVLATTNMVAFNGITGEEAIEYLQAYNLWDYVTSDEKNFLEDPTDEKKSQETWKCEAIWTLMWSLKIVDDLGYPNQMCDLNNITAEKYPIGQNKDPNDFIESITESRTKAEILDANDLYYRIDWACVDARINGLDLKDLNPGVVYERHYALNWLVNYMDQEWDDISTDT